MVLLFFTSSWLSSSPVKLPYWLGYSPCSDILIWYRKHISTKFYQATNLQVTSSPSRWWLCIWCQHQSDWVWKCCEKRFHPKGSTIKFPVVWWPSIPGISDFLGQSLSWIIIPFKLANHFFKKKKHQRENFPELRHKIFGTTKQNTSYLGPSKTIATVIAKPLKKSAANRSCVKKNSNQWIVACRSCMYL